MQEHGANAPGVALIRQDKVNALLLRLNAGYGEHFEVLRRYRLDESRFTGDCSLDFLPVGKLEMIGVIQVR